MSFQWKGRKFGPVTGLIFLIVTSAQLASAQTDKTKTSETPADAIVAFSFRGYFHLACPDRMFEDTEAHGVPEQISKSQKVARNVLQCNKTRSGEFGPR